MSVVKENFLPCLPCVAAIPLALGLTGTAATTAVDSSISSKETYKKINFYIKIASISLVVLFGGMFVYFKFIKKCTSCNI
jgi:hypothetical protein